MSVKSDEIEIETKYGDYAPGANYLHLVRRMLAFVPPACLEGIERIELRVGTPGNRAHRRAKRRWRGRKRLNRESLGLYYPRSPSRPPYIVLHVDNMDKQYAAWPHIPILRRMIYESQIAHTLFHEIGHHIHLTKQRIYRDRENVADEWAHFYSRRYLRARFWHLKWMLFLPIRIFELIARLLGTKRHDKLLKRRRKRLVLSAIEADIVAAYKSENASHAT